MPFLFDPDIFSNNLSFFFSVNMRGQVSHPYRTTETITVLRILITVSVHNEWEDIKQ
jgi:hypothetical protein